MKRQLHVILQKIARSEKMNDIRIGKFLSLPERKQSEFFDHYERMKEEFKVLSKENTILKEGLTSLKGDSQ